MQLPTSAPVHLRLLAPADEPFLWTALYHALHVPPGADPFPSEIVRQPDLACYVDGWMQRPGDLGVGAEIGQDLIGAAWLRRWRSGAPGFGFIDEATPELSMALLPGHRGQGIGTRLLQRLLAEAARESEAVSLSVSMSNPAMRLYERAGFAVVGQPAGGSVTMVTRLSPRQQPAT